MIYLAHYDSPVGNILLAERDGRLIGLWIASQQNSFNAVKEQVRETETALLRKSQGWLDRYFAGKKPQISELPLSTAGSIFRQTVWSLLCEIPYGVTISYGKIAQKAADKLHKETMSAQAVGGAVGHNPLSIIIPCHRVVGADGNLTGYAGGIDIKVKLLIHEGVNTKQFYVPPKRKSL